jgi:hypothetical protein
MAEKKDAAAKADKAEAVDSISEAEDGTFVYECPLNVLSKPLASSAAAPCGFVSSGHPTEDSAKLRGAQHEKEHATGEPMPEMIDFLTDNQIEV